MSNIILGDISNVQFKVGNGDCSIYLGTTLLYSGGTTPPTPPTSPKWVATYGDSSTQSAACDSSSAITSSEINLTNLVEVEIGDCVTSIGDSAFYECTSLTSVTIPDNVTSIGEWAFYNCDSLTSITIPDAVTSIGTQAFRECSGLTSVTIPDSVTSIGGNAFIWCDSLQSITVEAVTPPTLGNRKAFNDTNDCPIYVPSESVSAYQSARNWSTYASRIQAIPNS